MSVRLLLAAVVAACLTAPAFAQSPKLGTATQVEFTEKTPRYIPVDVGTAMPMLAFDYTIEQGDTFRIQVEAFKGAEMKFHIVIQKPSPNGMWLQHEASSGTQTKVDFTMSKALAGKKARILVYSDSVGKANLLISKVGDEPADDTKDAEIKKLKAENAELKKELADIKAQLADIKKLLEKKK